MELILGLLTLWWGLLLFVGVFVSALFVGVFVSALFVTIVLAPLLALVLALRVVRLALDSDGTALLGRKPQAHP